MCGVAVASVLAALCLATAASATTIVVVRSGGAMYLAADSRRIIGSARRQQVREACKIRVRGGLVMAAAGLVDLPGMPDLPGGVSLDRAFTKASESWTPESSLREKNRLFIERAIAEVRPYWQKLVSTRVPERKWRGQAVVQTVLVGSDGGTPVAIVTTLVPKIAGNVVSVEPRDFPFPESAPGVMLGVATAFNRLSLFERGQAFALPGREAAKRLVEAEFVSSQVGPPVNVVEISSGGIRWLDQSAACVALNSTSPR